MLVFDRGDFALELLELQPGWRARVYMRDGEELCPIWSSEVLRDQRIAMRDGMEILNGLRKARAAA